MYGQQEGSLVGHAPDFSTRSATKARGRHANRRVINLLSVPPESNDARRSSYATASCDPAGIPEAVMRFATVTDGRDAFHCKRRVASRDIRLVNLICAAATIVAVGKLHKFVGNPSLLAQSFPVWTVLHRHCLFSLREGNRCLCDNFPAQIKRLTAHRAEDLAPMSESDLQSYLESCYAHRSNESNIQRDFNICGIRQLTPSDGRSGDALPASHCNSMDRASRHPPVHLE
jgi:hypothetical protein